MSVRLQSLSVTLLALVVAASPAAAVKRRAFVTSVTGTGNIPSWPGSSGATVLERADSICRARAAAASLPNASLYRAWLSTSTVDAYCHVQGLSGTRANACGGASQPGGGPWYLVNGVSTFTPDLATLTGPGRVVYRGVYFDEFGAGVPNSYDGAYWTGTAADGTATQQNCSNWTTGDGSTSGYYGTARGGSYVWTTWGHQSCSVTKRLLCLEWGASETTSQPWAPGALVFVSTAQGLGNLAAWPQAGATVGIDAGDAICRNLASAAHLPSPASFVAWLSDDAHDAIDRLTTGGPFRRLDGYPVASSKADLVDGIIGNSPHQDENGAYIQNHGSIFTGTAGDGLATAFNCTNWTNSQSGSGTYGYATLARDDAWTAWGDNGGCFGDHRLLCFSNVITIFWDGFDATGDTGRWSSTTF
ncbi:MAG: hypothetical protein K8I65_15150 [Thermoanaerobaculia bacterium]|nr:hypothetical protein [Thermoanaerobaculia bacterium]